MTHVLLIDNYDSFTYNLYQILSTNDACVEVFRHDKVTLSYLKSRPYTHVVISPGPKTPAESGISPEVMSYYADKLPILGVCLGHQLMAHMYGGHVEQTTPVHGKKDQISHIDSGLHQNIPSPFKAARYNSLIVTDVDTTQLEITAYNNDGLIMGLRHRTFPFLEGVQYHPESFMTQYGDLLIENFLDMSYE